MTPENPENIDGQQNNAEMPTVHDLPPVIAPPLTFNVPPPPPPPATPYGFWSTLGISVLLFIVSQIGAGIVLALLFAFEIGGSLKHPQSNDYKSGFVMAITVLVGTPVLCGLIFLVIALRKRLGAQAYLGLLWPKAKIVLRWSLLLFLMLAIFTVCSLFIKSTVTMDFMVHAYKTAVWLPLLLTAVMLIGPIGEEFIFRGFLFEGFRHSRLGNTGAILLTSILWTALHIQYDLSGIAQIVITGFFLGYARVKTGSLWLCIWLHCLMNVIATMELLIHLHYAAK
jgi:uncharacterized protein